MTDMRISAARNHTHWSRFFHSVPEVLLDGVVQQQVVMADDEAGLVERYVLKDGNAVIEGDRFQTQTCIGRVELRGDLREHPLV